MQTERGAVSMQRPRLSRWDAGIPRRRHRNMPDGLHVPRSSLAALIERTRSGDALARESLASSLAARLRPWATGRLPASARGLIDTDDIVQETVLATLRRLAESGPTEDGLVLGYLRQAVRNRLIDAARAAARRPTATSLPDEVADHGASPLEALVGRESMQRYEQALEKLDPVERSLVVARLELDFGWAEVAELCAKPSADAARVACRRALLRLAEEVGHG